MAVGARRRDILLQFLAEAGAVSFAGGILGVIVGVLMSVAIARFGGWTVAIPAYAIFLSLGVALTVGVLFGAGPARRAAQLDPIQALRQE